MIAIGQFGSPNLAPDVNGLWGGVIVLGMLLYLFHLVAYSKLKEFQVQMKMDNMVEGNEINGLSLGGVGTGTTDHKERSIDLECSFFIYIN